MQILLYNFTLKKLLGLLRNYNFRQNQKTAMNIARENSHTILHVFRAQATHIKPANQM